MVSYELTVLTRVLSKPDVATILKRTADTIFQSGGIIRRIDNLGPRRLPYKISSHDQVHREANYYIVEFSAPPGKILGLQEVYNRDVDLVRSRIYKLSGEEQEPECTIEDELKPAPYRSEVIKLLEQIKAKEMKKKKFAYNTGMDYYPFQK